MSVTIYMFSSTKCFLASLLLINLVYLRLYTACICILNINYDNQP